MDEFKDPMDKGRHKRGSETGIVLVVVLIAIAILSTLVVDLIYFTQVDTEISANTRDEIIARYIAKSGIQVVAGTLNNSPLEGLKEISGVFGDQSGYSKGYWTIRVPSFPVGSGTVSITVIDERSKINLNALVSQTTNQVDLQVLTELRELFRMLGIYSGKSERFIASLINWLDHPIEGSKTKNDQNPAGADARFYESLDNPYSIKDGPLDSLEEIRLIDGMESEFFNTIKDYVTVYPRDKRVNFSTASKLVMMAAIKGASVSAVQGQETGSPEEVPDDVAESIAEAVIEARKDEPVIKQKRVREIAQSVDPESKISAGLTGVVLNSGESDVFSVISVGKLGEEESPTTSIVKAVIRKSTSLDSSRVKIISWKEQ
jgi:general secretion pathway protein K